MTPDYYKLPDGKELHETWDTDEAISYFKLSAIAHLYRAGKKDGENESKAVENAKNCLEKILEILEQV